MGLNRYKERNMQGKSWEVDRYLYHIRFRFVFYSPFVRANANKVIPNGNYKVNIIYQNRIRLL